MSSQTKQTRDLKRDRLSSQQRQTGNLRKVKQSIEANKKSDTDRLNSYLTTEVLTETG